MHRRPGPGAGGLRQAIRVHQGVLLQLVFLYVDAGHGQGIGDVGTGDVDIGVGHGGQAGQRAIAGTQIQEVARVVSESQPSMLPFGQLGDKAARHDGARPRHVKGHAHQPGFICEVSGGLAGANAFFNKRSCLRLLVGRYRVIFY